MLSFFVVGIELITFRCEIFIGEGDFSIGKMTRLASFLRLCTFRASLLKLRIDGFGRMVITLSIQVIQCRVF